MGQSPTLLVTPSPSLAGNVGISATSIWQLARLVCRSVCTHDFPAPAGALKLMLALISALQEGEFLEVPGIGILAYSL